MTDIAKKIEEGRQANIKARQKKAPAKALTPGQIKWRAQKEKSDKAAAKFRLACKDRGLPMPVREFRFAAPDRAWEADFAWPEERLILEVEGAAWSGGRHTRGSGYLEDMRKYNAMTLRGFRLVRCTPITLNAVETLDMVEKLIREWPLPNAVRTA